MGCNGSTLARVRVLPWGHDLRIDAAVNQLCVQQLLLQAPASQQVDVDRITFMNTARYLLCRMLGLAGVGRLIVNPLRPGRHEPRVSSAED